jgi:hypothetical protein
MCNDPLDHSVLAATCHGILEKIGGIVRFHGRIFGDDQHEGEHSRPATAQRKFFNSVGTLYSAAYRVHEGRYATSHYGDSALLDAWRRVPSFRMLK